MCNITADRKIDLSKATRDCGCDGFEYDYTITCPTCDGAKHFKKGTRKYKCKTCTGYGWVRREEPLKLGTCPKCKGTQRVPMNMYDDATIEDKAWIFENLFNFEKPYTGQYSGFNESYLGMGIYAGVTDYGRYREMTPEQFKEEVRDSFVNRFNQYIGITRNGYLPTEVLIRKSSSGWTAYPIYKTQN